MPRNNHTVQTFFAQLGPGLITGAADDDPSGIATYSVTGAGFGYGPLWTALFCFPLMAAVQLMCARLGMVSGRGLAAVVRRRYSRWVLWGACLLLIVANVINIAADLGGMAEATEMVTGIPSGWLTPVFADRDCRGCSSASYRFHGADIQMADAGAVRLRDHGVSRCIRIGARCCAPTFVPQIQWSSEYLVRAGRDSGHHHLALSVLLAGRAGGGGRTRRWQGPPWRSARAPPTRNCGAARTDVLTGMFFSNFVMYFIILTTAATLHAHGITNITTAARRRKR